MAAIGKIRSWGPWLVGIIALALFGFIAGDMWRSCETTSNQQRQQVGQVKGEKLNIQDYTEMVEEYKEVMKMMGRGENMSEEQLDNLRDAVWENYIQGILIGEEAEKLGLMVTDDEVKKVLEDGTSPVLMSMPLLPDFVDQQTRRFNYQTVKAYYDQLNQLSASNPQAQEQLQEFDKYWKFVEKNLRQQLLISKYESLLAACMQSNNISAKAAFDANNTQTRILLGAYPYAAVNDNDVKVSDADLQKKYDEKKESFKLTEENRDVKFVAYQITASAADSAKLLASLTEAAEQFKKDSLSVEEIVRKYQSTVAYNAIPASRTALSRTSSDLLARIDSMSVGQVSDPFVMNGTMNVVKMLGRPVRVDSVQIRAIPATTAAVADSLLQVIKGGKDFDSVAVNMLGQAAQKQWITSADFQATQTIPVGYREYYNKVVAMGKNEVAIIDNPQNPDNKIVLEVTDRKAETAMYDYAIVSREITFSNDTYNEAYNKFSQFVTENQSVEAMEKNAAKYNYTVSDFKNITTATHNIQGIPGTSKTIQWVFEAKEGEVSQPYDRCGDNDMLVVVGLTKIHPVGYRELESVKDMLRNQVLVDKKYELIAQKLNGVKSVDAAKAKDAAIQIDTIPSVKFGEPASLRMMGATESVLSGAVAATPVKGFSKKVIKGNAGAYVFEVLDRTETPEEFKANDVEKRLRATQRQLVYYGKLYLQDLKNKSDIVDNRYLFR